MSGKQKDVKVEISPSKANSMFFLMYEIEREVMECMAAAADPETGEIVDEELLKELEKLDLRKDVILNSLGKLYKSSKRISEAINAEIEVLKKRKEKYEKVQKQIKEFLQSKLEPSQKYEFVDCVISWRKSSGIEINESELDLDQLESILPEAVTYEPKINKTIIKNYYKEHPGIEISGVRTYEKQNIQIK